MNPFVWSIFHDGDILSIYESSLIEYKFVVSLEYLSRSMNASDMPFTVIAHGCSGISYMPFSSGRACNNIDQIICYNLEILCASVVGDRMEVMTVDGVMYIKYDCEEVVFDGRIVSYEELVQAANRAVRNRGE